MEYRTLELTLVSAKGLKKASLIGKMDVYAVAYISGTPGNVQMIRTPVDKGGGPNPTWNFPIKFTVNEAAALQNRLTLVIEIKAVGMFGDRDLGVVHVPIKELLDGVKTEGKAMQFVSYQVRKRSGKPKGSLSFSYKFGEKYSGKAAEPVTAYPPGMAVGSSSSYPPSYAAAGGYNPIPAAGYAYQQQQQPGHASYPPPPPPGYGGYPPQQGYGYPPLQQPQQRPRNKLGMGLGAGLLGGALGGMLIGDMMSDSAGGCGGGCGGGGCGGGGCGGF